MGHYQNFKVVTYIPEAITMRGTRQSIEREYAFLEKYVGLDKVYLETFREELASREQVLLWKEILESHGVEVSGGMTTVMPDLPGNGDEKRQRLFHTLCYSNPAMREKIREVSEFTAGLFDEVILDDYFFTNCTCEDCRKAKGNRSWKEYRRDLMTDVSENLIVGPAKKVNPKVRMIIKYPNWRESYAFTGYRPMEQKKIFDGVYTGTETRMQAFQDQHLPEYLSYALVRWMDHAAPGQNGGGWLDPYQCWSTDRYLEQAYLTALSGAKEIMLFEWADLIDNKYAGALGIQLQKLDRILSRAGSPVGVPAYIPYNASGENHVEMRLGMQGIPVEPTPVFPEGAPCVLLTESSLEDPEIFAKIRSQLLAGGNVAVTTGFVSHAPRDLWEEYSEAVVTGRSIPADHYWVTDDPAGYLDGCRPVRVPEIRHGNNASWSLVDGGSGDYHTPLLLKSPYGTGSIYTISVPENPSDFAQLPPRVLDPARRVLSMDGVWLSGQNVSLFSYDNGLYAAYRYVKDPVHEVTVVLHSKKPVKKVVFVTPDRNGAAEGEEPMQEVHSRFDLEPVTEWTASIHLAPGEFVVFRLE